MLLTVTVRRDNVTTPNRKEPAMTNGYSTLTKRQAQRDIREMRQAAEKIAVTPQSARAFLIRAGILDRTGKRLASQYR